MTSCGCLCSQECTESAGLAASAVKVPRRGPLHVASAAPLLSRVCARWFSLELKTRGNARQFGAEIVNCADDVVICTWVSGAAMRVVVVRMMERMRSPLNATKCRCVHAREEPLAFLRHRVGRDYEPLTGAAYIGTRPCRSSIGTVYRMTSWLTEARHGMLPAPEAVNRLEPSHARLGELLPSGTREAAYAAVDAHAVNGMRQRLRQ